MQNQPGLYNSASRRIKIKIMKNNINHKNQDIQFIQIHTDYIKLQDLLKLTGVCDTGGAAKIAVQSGEVSVNGEICDMRGKKIRPGDLIAYQNQTFQVFQAR